MDIQYTILGLLNWQPLSGYDLKKMIAESELFYWSGNNNQIYNSLIELHRRGLVIRETWQQENLPAKKIYTITDAGRAELHGWLLSNPEMPEYRNNFLIQLAWMDELSGDELDAILARYAEEITILLKMRQVKLHRLSISPERSPREKFLWKRIEENLAGMYQRELEWVNALRQDLREKYHNRTE
ncbi:MAG: PadR family transcriptional regulator [Anaerolineaceae bacterium]|nr:PadR family transcriptional regulator [Anaerolineaceae bacterium]